MVEYFNMWAILSISAALLWSVVNIIDKYVLSKWIREPLVVIIIISFIGLIASGGVYFIYEFQPISYFNILLALLAGVFHFFCYILYFKALKIEEVSRVVPLFYLSPLFILFLAAIFLGEVFTPSKYLGILLLVIGAILISLKNLSKISFGRAFYLMVLSAFTLAINSVLVKYLLGFTDYWTIFAYERIGAAIGSIPIIYLYLPRLIDIIREHGKRVIAILSVAEFLNLLALLLITIATSIGFVTLVNALSSIQPFFVLVLAVILSTFYPFFLKEEIGKSVILLKLSAILLMFIGAVLIT